MNSLDIGNIVNNLKRSLDFQNSDVRLYSKSSPNFPEDNGIAILLPGYIAYDSKDAEGKYTISIDEGALDFYSPKELKGFVASAMCYSKLYQNGYRQNIRNGLTEAATNIPELSIFTPFLCLRLEISSAEQIAIEKGLHEEIYSMMLKNSRVGGEYITRALHHSNPNFSRNTEDQMKRVIGNCASVPLHTLGLADQGDYIDGIVKKTLRELSVGENVISNFNRIRKTMEIRNDPKIEVVKKNVIDLFKLYAELI